MTRHHPIARALGLVLALTIGAHVGTARAATAEDPDLQRYIIDRGRIADLTRTVMSALPRLSPRCSTPRFPAATSLKVLTPLVFDESGRITSGLFVERVPTDLCGKTVTLNVFAIVTPNSQVRRVVLLPGDSLADPQLQRDAAPAALQVAATTNPACKTPVIENTRVATPKTATGWVETWDVGVCERAVPVDVRFTIGADGTDYAATLHRETKAP